MTLSNVALVFSVDASLSSFHLTIKFLILPIPIWVTGDSSTHLSTLLSQLGVLIHLVQNAPRLTCLIARSLINDIDQSIYDYVTTVGSFLLIFAKIHCYRINAG